MDKRPSIAVGSDGPSRRKSSVMFQPVAPYESRLRGKRRESRKSVSDGTESALKGLAPSMKLENTYRVEPKESDLFFTSKVEKSIRSIFERSLGNADYSPINCSEQCKSLSSQIKQEVKKLGFKRHKIVCQVIIGELKDQGFQAASRALWDLKLDNYACAEYQNSKLFAIGMVHGVYYD